MDGNSLDERPKDFTSTRENKAIVYILSRKADRQKPVPTRLTKLAGEVSVDGKPMKKGRILFYDSEGQIAGCIIRDGKYKIEEPNVGEQVVTIDGQNVANRYSDSEKSGLICEIGQNIDNRFDFHLSSK
jgi:hypothetical protein